jgi:molybdopterin-containing oxidoreductase family membrane subunit
MTADGALNPEAGPAAFRRALWGIWAVAMAAGIAGVYQRIAHGHLPAGYGSYVPWGLWIALYFHGVGIAGGAFLLGAGGFILGWPGFRSLTALRTVIVLSVAAFAASFLGIWFDLGHMERANSIFTHPSFTSMMAYNAWMYGAFMLAAAAAFFLTLRHDNGWLKPVLCLATLFAILFPSQSGSFFGVVDAKSHWHSPLLPILFLTSAVTAGAAVLMVMRWILPADDRDTARAIGRLRWVLLTGMCVYFAMEAAEFSLALWNPNVHAPAIELILWGPYWWVFWIVHLLLGGILPLVLLLRGRTGGWIAAGFLVAVTFVSGRLNVLIPGQAVGEIAGLQEAFHHDRLKYIYHATPVEYMVGLFMLAVAMSVFYVGRQIVSRMPLPGGAR